MPQIRELLYNHKNKIVMTDKQKLDAIKAEIHRLVDVRGYDREMANDLLAFMNSLPNEPVSEDLEEAANKYAKDYLFTPKPQRAPNIHFINGANWQKQQMMAKAVDVTIAIPYQNGYGGYTQLVDSKEGLPFGENLKVLVIKE